MEGPSYEDISPSEGEVTEVPAVLPLLSEQELRRVLEDLQGENSGLELWEGERELTGVPPNLVQPPVHQEEKSQEAAHQGSRPCNESGIYRPFCSSLVCVPTCN